MVSRAAPEKIVVADQSVVVAGPPGYCVDPGLSQPNGSNAFVMMGSCASIAGRSDRPAPRVPAVLTVSVSPELAAPVELPSLRGFLQTPSGLSALSRSGDPSSVDILETRTSGEALFIHARDTSSQMIPGVTDTYWRALFDLNGRLVTASVVGFETRPITRDTGLATLRALTDRLRQENVDGSADG